MKACLWGAEKMNKIVLRKIIILYKAFNTALKKSIDVILSLSSEATYAFCKPSWESNLKKIFIVFFFLDDQEHQVIIIWSVL